MTSPTFCIQPCEDVVCVVREEPPIVQHGGEHLSHCHDTRGGGGGGRGGGRGGGSVIALAPVCWYIDGVSSLGKPHFLMVVLFKHLQTCGHHVII